MTTFFVDTSALAKRYLNEPGGAWVRNWIVPAAHHLTIISDLTPVEMFSLLARKQRENLISDQDLSVYQNEFMRHVQSEYLSIPLNASVLTLARMLTGRHKLRA
ncbi:MAG: type II toxin-antitoxin system VapC family toxin [Aggregatilineales bacterium]